MSGVAAANPLALRGRRGRVQLAGFGAVLVTNVLTGAPAAAQAHAPIQSMTAPVASGDEDRRNTLFQQGVEAASAARWADAKARFAEALEIRVSPRVLFSLAETEEHLGQLTEAMSDYERSAAATPADPEVVRLSAEVRRRLDARIPQIRLRAAAGSVTAVTVDDRPATLDVPLSVDPGEHRIGVTAADGGTLTITVAVAEGQRLDVPLRLQEVKTDRGDATTAPAPLAATIEATTASTSPDSSRSPWKTVGWITAGVGVVGLGIGAAFGIDAKVQLDASNRSGCSGDACNAQGTSTRHQALDAATVSTVAFIAGGVLAAAGVALWLLPPSRTGASAAMSAAAAPGGGALLLSGAW
jgi:hypothetical protein